MKRVLSLLLLLSVGVLANAYPGKPRPEIMGITLDMSRDDAQARLKAMGNLEKEERKRQEVWAITDPRISHLLVGYDAEYRVRYVTAIARTAGPRITYQEIADVKNARRQHNQSNYRYIWEVSGRYRHFTYIIMAQGRDPKYLDSYSIKKLDEEEID